MDKCLIVINELCGRSKLVNESKIKALYSQYFDTTVVRINNRNDTWSPEGYHTIVICGGDGTFNRTINSVANPETDIIYYSFGTFNEFAKNRINNKNYYNALTEYVAANRSFIGYVCAAGSFTPLGYIVPEEEKKKMGIFAYIRKILSQYKVYNIPAKVDIDGEQFEDHYTLLMIIDSKRCFGFKFNHLYKENDGQVHILLIKSPGKNNFINKVKIFFPLFRAFFIGFRKEVHNKHLIFKSAKHINILLEEETSFDVDGDEKVFKDLTINVVIPKNRIYIGNLSDIKK